MWELVQESYPGVRLESAIQGWAFLERFEDGLAAYNALRNPSPKDDRWVGVCHFQMLRDMDALEALYRASNRGEEGAHVYLAHVLPFVDRVQEASEVLARVDFEALSSYDKAFYFRVLSLREETNGNLREALRAAEEAWKRIQGVPEYAILAPSILAQLAVLHGRIGRAQRALWFLERGLGSTSPGERLKVRVRRAAVLVSLGRYQEALVDLDALELAEDLERFQPERLWLLGQIAMANGSLSLAIQRFNQSIDVASRLQINYEELLGHLSLVGVFGVRRDFKKATEHLTRAQALISDKSDRLQFRFREVLLNLWMLRYTQAHALQELEGLIVAFEEMGLLQEQALVRLHKAEILRAMGSYGWQRELDELQALSVALQNPALLAREWALLPSTALREVAFKTHTRLAGQTPVVLEVHTLGDERLQLDTKPVSIPLRKGIELLAYFLENRAVSLKRILADVFPDEKPSASKSYFHQFRHQLRENVRGVEIEYDSEARLYRLKSEIDILWDVDELRAGRVMGQTGIFLPSSGNEWATDLDRELDLLREKR